MLAEGDRRTPDGRGGLPPPRFPTTTEQEPPPRLVVEVVPPVDLAEGRRVDDERVFGVDLGVLVQDELRGTLAPEMLGPAIRPAAGCTPDTTAS